MLGWAWNRFLNCVFSEGIRYIRFVFAGFNVGAEHCFDATEDTACYCYDQFLANLIYQIIGYGYEMFSSRTFNITEGGGVG